MNHKEYHSDIKELRCNRDKLLRVTDEDWINVYQHFNVTPQIEKESVEFLQSWFKKEAHLPKIDIEDEFIRRMLSHKSYSVERTKELLDNYFTARRRMPEFVVNRDTLSEDVIRAFDKTKIIPLPQLTPEHHRVTIIRKNSPQWDLVESVRACLMVGDYRLMNDMELGDHWIFDLELAALSDAMQFNPMIVSKFMFYLLSCNGTKLKGIHFVKLPAYGVPVVNLLKKTMKEKVAQRLHTYNDFEELFKIFPREIFPSDFGGDEVPSQQIRDAWLKTFQTDAWRNWFLYLDTVETDEALRTGKRSKFDDAFGVDGTFRNIEID